MFSPSFQNQNILKGIWPFLILLILGLSLYGRTLFFDFTYLDDNTLIIENAPLISDLKNIGQIFSDDVFFSAAKFYYRPLLNVSFLLDMTVAGPAPVIFHLTNITIHILAAWLVWRLFIKLQHSPALSFFLAILFLVHPVMTQAVAWIPGRNDSLLAVLVLSAFLAFLNFKDQPRLGSYISYLTFLFLALLTKETAIFLPALVIFYFLFIEPKKIMVADRWLLVSGSAAAGFLWFLMRHFALGGETTAYISAFAQIIKNSPALLIYLGKLILPFNLNVFPILADSTLVYGLIVLLLMVGAYFRTRLKRNNYIIFGLLWFLVFLLPAFIRINGLPDFLEHRLYLSFVGFLIILVEISGLKDLDFRRQSVKIIGAIILLILAILTWQHSSNFRDRLTFWQSAAAGSPHSPLAQRNLGVMYYFNDDLAAAKIYYNKALTLNPQEPMVHNNLGVIYLEEKNFPQAEIEFQAELALDPNYDKALFNLGEVYYQQKNWVRADQLWTQTLRVNPRHYQAYEHLLILQNQLR